jgi:hypothetical protein
MARPPKPYDTPKKALHDLLLSLFSAEEFRRWLSLGPDEDIDVELPGATASLAVLVSEAIGALLRRGRIDASFFERLKHERASCASQILAVKKLWSTHDVMSTSPLDHGTLVRTRKALAAATSTIRLVGFPTRGPKPAARLLDTCVPPRLRRGESLVPWTTSRLLTLLLSGRDPAPRVVVIGGPGSGKTTLCQLLEHLLACGAGVTNRQTPELVPLHVRLRDLVRRSPTPSFIRYACERAQSLHVDIDPEFLTRACDEGRAVLLLDGLDEAGDATARAESRDRLNAFLTLYPRVPALVTSREVGYGEVPLPESGDGAFLHLSIAPFDDEEMAEFAHRWAAATERDVAAAERAAEALLAAVRASPTVRRLAENRLLFALVAMIHGEDALLPGERVVLFERCLQMFLDTWPRARGKSEAPFPLLLQRRLLETLGAAMAGRKDPHAHSLEMPRHALLEALAAYLRDDEPDTDGESRIPEWVDHLTEVSGLLTEVRPGVYQFAHRSLQEYLAASWYMRAAEDPAGVIVDDLRSPSRREVWLMLAGLLGRRRDFVAALYSGVIGRFGDHEDGWSFLLDAMGEEVDFSSEEVAAILTGALQVPEARVDPSLIEQAIARLWRFSPRHGPRVRAWFEAKICHGPREELPSLVWAATAATDVETIVRWLDTRGDRIAAAAALAPTIWPIACSGDDGSRVALTVLGEWAWRVVDVESALALLAARDLEAIDVVPAAFTALQTGVCEGLMGALALQLAVDQTVSTSMIQSSAAWAEVSAIHVEPGCFETPIALPSPIASATESSLSRSHVRPPTRRWIGWSGRFSPWIDESGVVDLNEVTSRFEGISLFQYWVEPAALSPEDFIVDARVHYGSNCFDEPDEFGDYDQYLPGNDYPLKEFELAAWGALDGVFTAMELPLPAWSIPLPNAVVDRGPYRLRERLEEIRTAGPVTEEDSRVRTELVDLVGKLHAQHAAQALIAVRSISEDPALCAVLSTLRQQQIWILHNWRAVEQGMRTGSPLTLALTLALGWTQCLTTGRWPDSPQWRTLLAGPPPSHWWPRVHWHLCWLTANPGDREHMSGLAGAIEDGTKDAELVALVRGFHPRYSTDFHTG